MNYCELCSRAHNLSQHWPHRGSSSTLIGNHVTNKSQLHHSARVFAGRDLEALCPILKILNSLNLIGLSGLRVTRDDLGQIGYIITIYERF
jgi:hypothetical protein